MSRKKKGAHTVGLYMTGSLARQLVGFIMLPVYTSYLTPADYGVVALLAATIAVFESAIGARFAQALPKFYFEEKAQANRNEVVSTALFTTISFSLVGSALLALASVQLAESLFDNPDYAFLMALYGTLLLTTAVENYGLALLRIKDLPIPFVTASLAKLVLQLSLNIWFIVYLDLRVEGVVYSAVISSMLFSLGFFIYMLSSCGVRVRMSTAKRLFLFSWPLWLAGFAALYINSSSRFFLKYFADLSDVGLFELASKFAAILTLLIWTPFSQWWEVERFKIYNESQHPEATYSRVFTVISTLLTMVAVGISIYSEPVIVVMASTEFHAAHSVVGLLTFTSLLLCLSYFFNFPFLAKSRTIIITKLQYFTAILITILLLTLTPQLGLAGAAYAMLVTYIISLMIRIYLSARLVKMVRNIWRFGVVMLISGGFVYIDMVWGEEQDLGVMLGEKTLVFVAYLFAMLAYMMTDANGRTMLMDLVRTVSRGRRAG